MADLASLSVSLTAGLVALLVGGVGAAVACLVRSARRRADLEVRVWEQADEIAGREALFAALAERVEDGVIVVAEDRVISANARTLSMLGRSDTEVAGRPFAELVHESSRAKVLANHLRRMAGDRAPQRYEAALAHRDGGAVKVELSGVVIPLGSRSVNLVVLRDLAARIRADEAAVEKATQIEQAAVRARELMRKAAAASRAKSEFLANMSNELRTPLTSIVGMTDLLKEEAFGPVNPSQRESLGVIEESSQQLLNLINDILDMARLESGHVELDLQEVDVAAICGVCMRYVRNAAAGKGVSTIFECTEAPATLWADPRRLRIVLINLLGNAIKFTPSGGTVALVAAPGEGGGVRFTVSDTGVGISRDKLAGLFEPFKTGDASPSRKTGGAGLGLAMVRRIVDLHGGVVSVKSTPGMGSSFTVTLPDFGRPAKKEADALEKAAIDAAVVPPNQALEGCRILVAEDDETNARILELQLQHAGAQVTVVGNGRDAVERARALQPDLVLMDVQMPVMNGIKATAALKGDPLTAGIPVICLTVLAMDEDRDRCLAAGADDHLIKPVDMRALISKLRRQSTGSKAPV